MPIASRTEPVKPKLPVLPKPGTKVGFKPRVTAVLKRSTIIDVVDIPVELLEDSPENPNEQDEAIFDQLVEGMKEDGFDEPIHVVPIQGGKFQITSGHHRAKAAKLLGMAAVPAILKPGWTDEKRKTELVRRDVLKGSINPAKFTHLFNELLKGNKKDGSVLRQQIGLVKDQLFNQLYKQVEHTLSPVQKKKLIESKDKINSTESFSQVLHDIFKAHGTELDYGLVCFKYGDSKKQNVWYVKCDAELDKQLKKLQEEIQNKGLHAEDVFKALLKNADLSKVNKSAKVAAAIEARTKK